MDNDTGDCLHTLSVFPVVEQKVGLLTGDVSLLLCREAICLSQVLTSLFKLTTTQLEEHLGEGDLLVDIIVLAQCICALSLLINAHEG